MDTTKRGVSGVKDKVKKTRWRQGDFTNIFNIIMILLRIRHSIEGIMFVGSLGAHPWWAMMSGWVPFVIMFFSFIPQGCTYGPICAHLGCMYVCVCVSIQMAHLGVVFYVCVCVYISLIWVYVCEYIHIHILTYICPRTGFVVWTLKFLD